MEQLFDQFLVGYDILRLHSYYGLQKEYPKVEFGANLYTQSNQPVSVVFLFVGSFRRSRVLFVIASRQTLIHFLAA